MNLVTEITYEFQHDYQSYLFPCQCMEDKIKQGIFKLNCPVMIRYRENYKSKERAETFFDRKIKHCLVGLDEWIDVRL